MPYETSLYNLSAMKKPNSSFWKMVGKHIVLPMLLYFFILLLSLVTNHSSWLNDKAITRYIPGLIIIASIIWMWAEHNSVFVKWSIDFWGDWGKMDTLGRYKGTFHMLSSILLMAALCGSMYGIYFFVANRVSVRQIEKFDAQTDISNDIRIVVDDLLLDSSLVTITYDVSFPKSKYMDYKIITANVYRCIKNRPDVWLVLSDSIHVDECELQSDSVVMDYVDVIYKKKIPFKPQHAQSYCIDKIEYEQLVANMQGTYEEKYGEKTFPQGTPIYVLSPVDDFKKHLMLIIIVPFTIMFFIFIYRLSIYEDKINNDYENHP